jgi:hypothetical protein
MVLRVALASCAAWVLYCSAPSSPRSPQIIAMAASPAASGGLVEFACHGLTRSGDGVSAVPGMPIRLIDDHPGERRVHGLAAAGGVRLADRPRRRVDDGTG